MKGIGRIAVTVMAGALWACSSGGPGSESGGPDVFDTSSTPEVQEDILSANSGDTWTSTTDTAPEGGCPNATGPGTLSPDDLQQSLKVGNTEIDILFRAPLPDDDDPEHLTFEVAFTNHTCSVPGYDDDLVGKATVVNSEGLSTSDFTYEVGSKDSHHGTGVLKVARGTDETDLIGCETTSLTLTLADIDGGDPSFVWGEEFLNVLK